MGSRVGHTLKSSYDFADFLLAYVNTAMKITISFSFPPPSPTHPPKMLILMRGHSSILICYGTTAWQDASSKTGI